MSDEGLSNLETAKIAEMLASIRRAPSGAGDKKDKALIASLSGELRSRRAVEIARLIIDCAAEYDISTEDFNKEVQMALGSLISHRD